VGRLLPRGRGAPLPRPGSLLPRPVYPVRPGMCPLRAVPRPRRREVPAFRRFDPLLLLLLWGDLGFPADGRPVPDRPHAYGPRRTARAATRHGEHPLQPPGTEPPVPGKQPLCGRRFPRAAKADRDRFRQLPVLRRVAAHGAGLRPRAGETAYRRLPGEPVLHRGPRPENLAVGDGTRSFPAAGGGGVRPLHRFPPLPLPPAGGPGAGGRGGPPGHARTPGGPTPGRPAPRRPSGTTQTRSRRSPPGYRGSWPLR